MKIERFKELVNLYLDDELSQAELREFRSELLLCPARKSEFEERLQLNRAIGLVLDSSLPAEDNATVRPKFIYFLCSFGLVACIALSAVLLPFGGSSQLEQAQTKSDLQASKAWHQIEFERVGYHRAEPMNWASVNSTAPLPLLNSRTGLAAFAADLPGFSNAKLLPHDTRSSKSAHLKRWPTTRAIPNDYRYLPRVEPAAVQAGGLGVRRVDGFKTSLTRFR